MKDAQAFWDKAAATYDLVEEKDQLIYYRAIEKTKSYLNRSDKVLDYGCGTGHLINEVADQVEEAIGIDMSPRMIEIAKKKAEDNSRHNAHYSCQSLFDNCYGEGSFHAIFTFYILHLLEDVDATIKRIHELLIPGGLLIGATPCIKEVPLYRAILYLGGKMGIVPKVRAYKINDLKASFLRAGFDIIEEECLRQKSREYYIVAKKQV